MNYWKIHIPRKNQFKKNLVGKKVDFIIGQAYILIEKNDTSFSFGSTATITLKYNITDWGFS